MKTHSWKERWSVRVCVGGRGVEWNETMARGKKKT